jgi:hypothetical protein
VQPMTTSRQPVALLALLCLLIVTTVSALPGHGHECDTARPCDICHSGHLPCLQPSGAIQIGEQMPVVWGHVSEEVGHCPDSAAAIRSSRAPPV